jgi:hypothetical protein
MKKKFKYDGKSRPATDLYKKEFDRIFGKKEPIEDPFKKEVKEEKIDDKEFEKIIERNGF